MKGTIRALRPLLYAFRPSDDTSIQTTIFAILFLQKIEFSPENRQPQEARLAKRDEPRCAAI